MHALKTNKPNISWIEMKNLPKEFWEDREFVFAAVKYSGYFLKYAPKFHEDKELAMFAVSKVSFVLEYLPKFQDDKEVVMAAVTKGYSNCFKFASERLRNDRDVVLAAVTRNGGALEFAPKYQDDKEIVMRAIASDKEAFKFASDRLKNDKAVVYNAIKSDGYNIKYASDDMKKDKELALIAVSNSTFAFDYLPMFQDDRDVALAAVKLCGNSFYHISERLKDNTEIFLTSYLRNKDVKQYASKRLQNCYLFKKDNVEIEKEIKLILKLCEKPESFANLPLERFISKNREFLQFTIDAIRQKLAELPKTEENLKYIKEISKLIKKTIKDKIEEFKNNCVFLEEADADFEM